MRKLSLIIFFNCIVIIVNAQLKVSSYGDVGIGTSSPQYKLDLFLGEDRTARIRTWTDVYINNTGNCGGVCIYPNDDFYLQLGKQGYKVGEIWCHTLLYWSNIVNISDMRFKENIAPIESPLARIRQINGIRYTLKEELFSNLPDEKKAEYTNPDFGFIAQDIKGIFPELIVEDDSGYLSVKYVRMIPVLVEAIKEQQKIIDSLKQGLYEERALMIERINEIHNAMELQQRANNNSMRQNNVNPLEASMQVYQNSPNPFIEETIVHCYVPANKNDVRLCIYDVQGNQRKCIPITNRGTIDVRLAAGELPAGIYLYLLQGDGQVTESKQMIITK